MAQVMETVDRRRRTAQESGHLSNNNNNPRGGRGRSRDSRAHAEPEQKDFDNPECKVCNRRHRGKCWVQYPEEAPGHLRDAYKKRHNNWKADKGKNKSPDNNKSTSDIEDYGLTLLESINIPRVRALMYQYLDEPTMSRRRDRAARRRARNHAHLAV